MSGVREERRRHVRGEPLGVVARGKLQPRSERQVLGDPPVRPGGEEHYGAAALRKLTSLRGRSLALQGEASADHSPDRSMVLLSESVKLPERGFAAVGWMVLTMASSRMLLGTRRSGLHREQEKEGLQSHPVKVNCRGV
jgi:hypothetical protein